LMGIAFQAKAAPFQGSERLGLASEAAIQRSLVRRLSNYYGNDILAIR
jgi:hypothetical protein